jgi:hypothetical protein
MLLVKGGIKMRKIVFGLILVILLLLFFPVTKSAYENVSIGKETNLEVNARVFGIWRIKFIVITLKNIGDEKVKIRHGPGGGFEIYNSEQRVFRTKSVPIRILYSTTLYPGLPRIFDCGLWFGFDDFGRILPKGEYFVKGFVWLEDEILYGELVRFHLGIP